MVKRPQIYSVWSTPTPEDADDLRTFQHR